MQAREALAVEHGRQLNGDRGPSAPIIWDPKYINMARQIRTKVCTVSDQTEREVAMFTALANPSAGIRGPGAKKKL